MARRATRSPPLLSAPPPQPVDTVRCGGVPWPAPWPQSSAHDGAVPGTGGHSRRGCRGSRMGECQNRVVVLAPLARRTIRPTAIGTHVFGENVHDVVEWMCGDYSEMPVSWLSRCSQCEVQMQRTRPENLSEFFRANRKTNAFRLFPGKDEYLRCSFLHVSQHTQLLAIDTPHCDKKQTPRCFAARPKAASGHSTARHRGAMCASSCPATLRTALWPEQRGSATNCSTTISVFFQPGQSTATGVWLHRNAFGRGHARRTFRSPSAELGPMHSFLGTQYTWKCVLVE